MRVNENCAACLLDKQVHRTNDEGYLREVRRIIDGRTEEDTAPYLVYLFNLAYERRFGKGESYREIKRKFNDLMLSMEGAVRERIEAAPDPLAAALAFARVGNYIDFGAMNSVDEDTFLSLFDDAALSDRDRETYASFRRACAGAERFLLIGDNCGEIVLDRLFLEELKKAFPALELTVMVRGGETFNDATAEDAAYAGLDRMARIVTNGSTIAGTICEHLPPESLRVLEEADVILAKGQGNYESLCGRGRHIFYSFLCKCELFTTRFQVPPLTGLFIEET